MGCANIAATLMEHLCNHDWHGYSQPGRYGDGEGTCQVDVEGRTYYLQQGDRDCSSAVIECWRSALIGTAYEGALDGAIYTGNMRQVFADSGLFDVWDTQATVAQRGDVYLNDADHTAMCTSADPDLLGEFSISENGGIDGEVGDQTGWESSIHGFYDFPWDCTLHYNGKADGAEPADKPIEVTPQPSQQPQTNGLHVRYRAYTQTSGWLPEMIDRTDTSGYGDDFAGDGSPITYLAMDFPGWYQVQTVNSGWLPKVSRYDVNDLENGCAGDGSPIIGVRCYYETQDPNATGWKAIHYAVNDLDEMRDTDSDQWGDDFAGNGKTVTKFYAYIGD